MLQKSSLGYKLAALLLALALLVPVLAACSDGGVDEDDFKALEQKVSDLAGKATAPAQKTTPKDTILEVDVTNFPQFHEGDPGIAVNPKDHNSLVFVSTVTEPWDQVGHFSMEQAVWYSTDRGETWTNVPFPFGKSPGAGVARVAADANGTFYLHYNALRAMNPVDDSYVNSELNMTRVSRSTDGGRTWSDPVDTPLRLSGQPRMRVDLATGKIYASGGQKFLASDSLTVSADQGRTWSTPVRFPAPMTGAEIAVYGGIFAAGYNEKGVYFVVTEDDGKTWKTFPVTDSKGTPVPSTEALQGKGGTGPYAYSVYYPIVAADPTQKRRFAAMVPREAGILIQFEIYITEDAGRTWTGPAKIIAEDPARPDMNFGLTGALGVMWRTHAVNAFATVSVDHGRTFSRPVKVNAVTQPMGDTGPMSDHWSWITLDDEYAYIGWADTRGGGALDAIFGRVPLSMFKPLPPTPFSTVIPTGIPSVQPPATKPPATTPPTAGKKLSVDSTLQEVAADPRARDIVGPYMGGVDKLEGGLKAGFGTKTIREIADLGGTLKPAMLPEIAAKLAALSGVPATPPATTPPTAGKKLSVDSTLQEVAADPRARDIVAPYIGGVDKLEGGLKAGFGTKTLREIADLGGTLKPAMLPEIAAKLAALSGATATPPATTPPTGGKKLSDMTLKEVIADPRARDLVASIVGGADKLDAGISAGFGDNTMREIADFGGTLKPAMLPELDAKFAALSGK